MTDYRGTKKKEALWQAKADEMQYPGKYLRNRFHSSDVQTNPLFQPFHNGSRAK